MFNIWFWTFSSLCHNFTSFQLWKYFYGVYHNTLLLRLGVELPLEIMIQACLRPNHNTIQVTSFSPCATLAKTAKSTTALVIMVVDKVQMPWSTVERTAGSHWGVFECVRLSNIGSSRKKPVVETSRQSCQPHFGDRSTHYGERAHKCNRCKKVTQ